ncbi:TetR/AcrR family transcriptional regulator [Salinispirillum marinum]|uniref:TetR/AcrR family transcriptional regulator n=2 Tax=Saccharospirillaceae TaxID=255527 RepID=A0ABV8BG34_9GAMM
MNKKALKQKELTKQLGVLFLAKGFSDMGLRQLADALGTSDRMLLYYFGSRDALLETVLLDIAQQLSTQLDENFGDRVFSPNEFLDVLWQSALDEAFADYLRLWLDISAKANRGDPLLTAIANKISHNWIRWAAGRLSADDAQTVAYATLMLSTVDGLLILHPNDLQQGAPAITMLKTLLMR